MPTNLGKDKKKKDLQAYKDKLLTELYYYDKRIEEARNNVNKSRYIEDDLSSDSDSELSLVMDNGPPISELKSKQTMLKTCLQATQELTSLEVLQSEVNVLVQAPVIENEPPINSPGTWREVTAECCVDLVPFSITFYAHHADHNFAPILYRGLKVTPLKASHEAELVKSVLPGLRRPSDAVEVLRSYAVAHRSRRSTLARLADKFGAALCMAPLETGGYQLKCANLLEVCWTLQNKWSPIAPFHHRLKFDLEYMDESYIKIITQAHRQLSDPSVDTDERTLLLAKIISTCLEAKPLEPDSSDQEQRGEMDSPVKEGGTVDKRRTTLDREPDVPNMKRKKDSEVMAPPKSLPKKVKPKNKSPSDSNIENPKSNKRSIQDESSDENIKKSKINNEIPVNNASKKSETTVKNPKSDVSDKTNVRSGKNREEKLPTNSKSDGDITADKAKNVANVQKSESTKNIKKPKNTTKKTTNAEKSDNNLSKKDVIEVSKNTGAVKQDNVKNVTAKSSLVKRKSMTNLKSNNEKQEDAKNPRNSVPSTNKKTVNDKTNSAKIDEKNNKVVKSATSAKNIESVEKPASSKVTEGNVMTIVKNITNEKGEVIKKVVKKLAHDKPKVTQKYSVACVLKSHTKKSNNEKVEDPENVKKGNASADKMKKPLNEQNTKTTKPVNQNSVKKDGKNPPKVSIFTANAGSIKKSTTGIEKENAVQNNTKTSKIPQKKIGTPKSGIKKMAVRVSPRKSFKKAKSPLAGKNLKKIVQKPITGIPRILQDITKFSTIQEDELNLDSKQNSPITTRKIKRFEKASEEMSFVLKLGHGLLTKPKPKGDVASQL